MPRTADPGRFLCVITHARLTGESIPHTDLHRSTEAPTPEEALRRFLLDQPLLRLGDILPRGVRRDVAAALEHAWTFEEWSLQTRVAHRIVERMNEERLLRAAARYGVRRVELYDLESWQRLWSMDPEEEVASLRECRAFLRHLATAPELVVVGELDVDEQIQRYGQILSDDLYLLDGDRCHFLFDFDLAPERDDAGARAEPETDPRLTSPGCPGEAEVQETLEEPWMPAGPIRSREEYPGLVREWLRHCFPTAADKPIRLATEEEESRAMEAIFPGVAERLADWEQRRAHRRPVRPPLRVRHPGGAWDRRRSRPLRLR